MRVLLYAKIVVNNIKIAYYEFQMRRIERTHGTTREQMMRLKEWREKIGGLSEKEKDT